MIKHIAVFQSLIVLIAFFSFYVKAQNESLSDTLAKYQMDEVIVNARRLSLTEGVSPVVVDKDEINQATARSVSDILAQQGFAFIKDYGGASGLKTISQRGLGAEHTVVLLNGMRISSLQNGLTDLGLYSIDEIERLEIVQGGHSAFFGPDAVGGVVNIISIPEIRNRLKFSTSFGSFGERRIHGAISGNAGNSWIYGSYGSEQSDGNFPFHFSNGVQSFDVIRNNLDMGAEYGSVKAGVTIANRSSLSLIGYVYSSERGVPNPVVSIYTDSKARQTDREGVVQFLSETKIDENFALNLNAQFHHQYERYRDPNLVIGGIPLDNFFKNNELRIETRGHLQPIPGLNAITGIEAIETISEGTSVLRQTTRHQYGIYLSPSYLFDIQGEEINNITLYGSARFDVISQGVEVFSPWSKLAINFQPIKYSFFPSILFSTFISASKNYRTPTFNELYWNGGGGAGNPNLEPEVSKNIEIGETVKFNLLGSHSLQVTLFENTMDDRIVWVPAGSLGVTPKNIRTSKSTGLELLYRLNTFNDHLRLGITYVSSSSTKTEPDFINDPNVGNQFPLLPEETMNIDASYSERFNGIVQEAILAMNHQLISYRYISEDNKDFIPGFNVTNCSVTTSIALGEEMINVKGEVLNIFNTEYQVMPAYPMPMRSYRISTTIEIF